MSTAQEYQRALVTRRRRAEERAREYRRPVREFLAAHVGEDGPFWIRLPAPAVVWPEAPRADDLLVLSYVVNWLRSPAMGFRVGWQHAAPTDLEISVPPSVYGTPSAPSAPPSAPAPSVTRAGRSSESERIARLFKKL